MIKANIFENRWQQQLRYQKLKNKSFYNFNDLAKQNAVRQHTKPN